MFDLLISARTELGKREDLANHKDIDFALLGITRKLDRYSEYVDPEKVAKFNQDISGRLPGGIGVHINKDQNTDQLKVVSPIKDSPAYKAGLQEGDLIVKIETEVDGKKVVKETKGLPPRTRSRSSPGASTRRSSCTSSARAPRSCWRRC